MDKEEFEQFMEEKFKAYQRIADEDLKKMMEDYVEEALLIASYLSSKGTIAMVSYGGIYHLLSHVLEVLQSIGSESNVK
jgi:hypothetical protein